MTVEEIWSQKMIGGFPDSLIRVPALPSALDGIAYRGECNSWDTWSAARIWAAFFVDIKISRQKKEHGPWGRSPAVPAIVCGSRHRLRLPGASSIIFRSISSVFHAKNSIAVDTSSYKET